jgi:selT/selW/selH-like putative selenoprotein
LAAALSNEFGVTADLERGDRGAFDVLVDGKLLFSKHTAGRFPETAEIVQAIRARST